MFNNIITFFLLTLLSFVTGLALAGTPDGDTPATEEVCDGLLEEDATPGLYGLCVAYCEAQDLDGASNGKPSNSSSNLLKTYNNKRKSDDPEMPCIDNSCQPCFPPSSGCPCPLSGPGSTQ